VPKFFISCSSSIELAEVRAAWRSSRATTLTLKAAFTESNIRSELYGDSGNDNPLRKIITKANRHTLSRVVQLRTKHRCSWGYLTSIKCGISERNHNNEMRSVTEKANHLLKDCTLCESQGVNAWENPPRRTWPHLPSLKTRRVRWSGDQVSWLTTASIKLMVRWTA
jgi:hypothetical protein